MSDALSGVVLGLGPSNSIVDFSHVCIGNWAKKRVFETLDDFLGFGSNVMT